MTEQEFYDQVKELFENGKKSGLSDTELIQIISDSMAISRGKVKKLLITLGLHKTEWTEAAVKLQKEGKTLEEIGEQLHISKGTVTNSLPYTKSVYNGDDPDYFAKAMREMRERQGKISEKRKAAKRHIKINPKLLRLRLEYLTYSDEEDDDLRKYAHIQHSEFITRDVLVPKNMTLASLHYVIQRAFGFYDEHLHEFLLYYDDLWPIVKTGKRYLDGMGIYFKAGEGDDSDYYGLDYRDDDLESDRSLRNFFRARYRAPYSRGDESDWSWYIHDRLGDYETEIMQKLGMIEGPEDQTEQTVQTEQMDQSGQAGQNTQDVKRRKRYTHDQFDKDLYTIDRILEVNEGELMECLPIGEILQPDVSVKEARENYNEAIKVGIIAGVTPKVKPLSKQIFYRYDMGDKHDINVKAMPDYDDLIDNDLLTATEIKAQEDLALSKGQNGPALLFADGDDAVEDVGGSQGLAEFYRFIGTAKPSGLKIRDEHYIEDPDEEVDPYSEVDTDPNWDETLEERLNWARGNGWSRRKKNIRTFF